MSEESTTPDLGEPTRQMAEAASRGDVDAYMSHLVASMTTYSDIDEAPAAAARLAQERG